MVQSLPKINYHLYACLPFIEIAHESTIRMGPVTFWPASRYKEFIPESEQDLFNTYMASIGEVKARSEEASSQWITTIRLPLESTTCISIDEKVSVHDREFLLIDSLYLLYFACTFRNLYYDNEVPSFNVFRKMIPASFDFISQKQNWEELHIDEINREETVCIHLFDHEICTGLGKMLSVLYAPHETAPSKTLTHNYHRLIRSIRYLVDRFVQRFINLFKKGLNFPEELFEPEDVIFLASSFEALFDINHRHPNADFKHKLRPLLHLKYSGPVELFWKWIDDFYEAKRQIVHGERLPDPLFQINPNFEVSHILIGIKLFIYSSYYTLFKYHLLTSETFDTYTPPDFKWIHPEEVLLFFWTETNLLKKLDLFMTNVFDKPHQDEMYADIHLLANLFISMYERYYLTPIREGIKFIPTPLAEIKGTIERILALIDKKEPVLNRHLPPEFRVYLTKRLRS